MKHIVFCALALAAVCGCRNANSAEVKKALQDLSQTVENPTMAVAPDEGDAEAAQVGEVVQFDKTVHDFGDISVNDGPQSCTFTVKNVGKEPIAIYEVVTSCGCTDAHWTREPLQPGKTGTISATYKNEDGPIPFDKTLTVYIAGVSKPVILRLRGVVHEKQKPLAELYGSARIGDLGLKGLRYKVPNVLQGESSSDEAKVANLGKKPLKLSFTEVSPNLTVTAVPSTIPAGETATLRFSVKADEGTWGRHAYYATPVLNGKKAGQKLEFDALTRGNFASWSAEERKNAAQCIFDESTVSFGTVTAGTPVEAAFSFTNKGKSALRIYSLDADVDGLTATLPGETPALKKGTLPVRLDTSRLPKGETVVMITLTTNCPARPMINLFLVGLVK
ncbi:MAG: DUF1573 domain-containing protein [Bacteroidales bacterium]|nr:DUF1573 domain-containing protein [Bacteroidales bacterium]